MIIYLAVNRVNQKAYVGQTRSDFRVRIGNHFSVATMDRDETPFHRAIRKYGKESFDFAVLEHCDSLKALESAEKSWITRLGCKTPLGYNRTDGGEGTLGCEYTDERREKIRQSQLGDRNRMKNPETAKKHADSIRGDKSVWWGKFGPAHNRFGKHHKLSEETKAKMRAYWSSEEGVARRRELSAKRKRSDEGKYL